MVETTTGSNDNHPPLQGSVTVVASLPVAAASDHLAIATKFTSAFSWEVAV